MDVPGMLHDSRLTETTSGAIPSIGLTTGSGKREGLALCLSGGGFRAALFHLGSLRRLHEVGALPRVTTVSSVSGGSILSGFLAGRMMELGQLNGLHINDFEAEIAEPFRRQIAGRDLRTWPTLLHLPWNWLMPGLRVSHLLRRYRRRLTGKLRPNDTLGRMPTFPEFIFCATDIVFGINWEFRRNRAGDYLAGYTERAKDWPIARAVAASACFPPLFGPMPLRLKGSDLTRGKYRGAGRNPDRERHRLCCSIGLSDGGVYDNMALEPIWKDHATVLVSDCGAPFTYTKPGHYLRRLLRYTSVVMNQAAAMRKRAFFADISPRYYAHPGTSSDGSAAVGDAASDARPGIVPQRDGDATGVTSADGTNVEMPPRYLGGYWGIAGTVDRYKALSDPITGYSRKLVDEVIDRIRTDLDRFTEAEMKVLENHGYLLTAAVLRRRRPELDNGAAAANAPHPCWMDEHRVRKALRRSHKRFVLKRLIGFDDKG